MRPLLTSCGLCLWLLLPAVALAQSPAAAVAEPVAIPQWAYQEAAPMRDAWAPPPQAVSLPSAWQKLFWAFVGGVIVLSFAAKKRPSDPAFRIEDLNCQVKPKNAD